MKAGDLNRLLKAAKADGQAVVIECDTGVIRLEPYGPPPPPPVLPAGACVYVVQVKGFDLVKIGYSTDVSRRVRELEAGAGMGGGIVELLRFPGDTRAERALHKRFAEQRLFGEWFTLSGPVAAWLSEQAELAA